MHVFGVCVCVSPRAENTPCGGSICIFLSIVFYTAHNSENLQRPIDQNN